MKTVKIPARKTKEPTTYPEALVDEVIAALESAKKGTAVAFDDERWYDTEGKCRTRARIMALLIKEKTGKQPRTHIIPDSSGEAWTPAVSVKP